MSVKLSEITAALEALKRYVESLPDAGGGENVSAEVAAYKTLIEAQDAKLIAMAELLATKGLSSTENLNEASGS
jgi:hypothetical protein